MSALWPAHDPLPYRPIKIVDVSPYRVSVRRPRATPTRRGRRAIAATMAAVLALALAITTVGASPLEASDEFRLGPGHAMPPSLLS